ncbi:unnamed protein product [Staurois parvus]|uniref:Riboflavin transporter n=1 Tax=Staurois parvus TaxID=386267 RepID=A0ABN9FJM4_9NEOB|nr:unnamed protein product [Staurois parvus]
MVLTILPHHNHPNGQHWAFVCYYNAQVEAWEAEGSLGHICHNHFGNCGIIPYGFFLERNHLDRRPVTQYGIPHLDIFPILSGLHFIGNLSAIHDATATQVYNDVLYRETDHYIQTEYLLTNFSVQVFLFLLLIMMIFCLMAFFFLSRHSQKENLNNALLQSTNTLNSCSTRDKTYDTGPSEVSGTDISNVNSPESEANKVVYSYGHYALIYLLTGWVNALTNGVLPSIQTYSCMPYGNLAYHLAAALGSMANPLACLIAMFLPSRSFVSLVFWSVLGTGFGAYNMMTAVMSPCPILHGTKWGVALIVISWVLFIGTLSYVKVMIGVILRSQSHSALVWCGAVVQLGSMIGALVMFPMVNVYGFFESADLCNTNCSS